MPTLYGRYMEAQRADPTCTKCGYVSSSKADLAGHMYERHFQKSQKSHEETSNGFNKTLDRMEQDSICEVRSSYECEKCGFTSNLRAVVARHVQSVHEKDTGGPGLGQVALLTLLGNIVKKFEKVQDLKDLTLSACISA